MNLIFLTGKIVLVFGIRMFVNLMLKMYLFFTIPFPSHVLRIYNKIIVDFDRLKGLNFTILLLVLKFCRAVCMCAYRCVYIYIYISLMLQQFS